MKFWKKLSICNLSLLAGIFGVHMSTLAKAESALDFKYQDVVGQSLNEENYQKLVQPVVNPTRYMFMTSGKSLGLLGFDVGVGATFFEFPKEAQDVAKMYIKEGSEFPSYLAIPRLTLQKGLPFGIDLGVNLAMIPSSELKLLGAAVQYTVFDGIWPLPKLSLRAGYTAFMGLEELAANAVNFEGVVGFNLMIVEPYGGIGYSMTNSKSKFKYDDLLGVSRTLELKTDWNDTYAILGARLSPIPFLGITGEVQISSIQTLYTAKLSVTF
jgi:hypothetical protein